MFRFTASGPPRDGLWAHYDVSHELGTGSFATVHKALSRRTGRFVAVKMIRSNKLAAPLNLDQNDDRSVNAATNNRGASFAREIQILSDLRHQNICQLIETFWTTTEISECNILIVLWGSGTHKIRSRSARAGARRRG